MDNEFGKSRSDRVRRCESAYSKCLKWWSFAFTRSHSRDRALY